MVDIKEKIEELSNSPFELLYFLQIMDSIIQEYQEKKTPEIKYYFSDN